MTGHTRADVMSCCRLIRLSSQSAWASLEWTAAVEQTALRDELQIVAINASDGPALDGDLSDPAWRLTRPVVVSTNYGANFDGEGTSVVEIRAVHDGEIAYFSFVMERSDPILEASPADKARRRLVCSGDQLCVG